MSIQEVLNDVTLPNEYGDPARRMYRAQSSLRRWNQLAWTFEARKMNMRRAAKRAKRLAAR